MSFIQVIKKKGYDILQLNRGKANPINNDFVTGIRAEIARAEADENCRGIIWTGNTPGFFSVGLDLKEIYHYDEKQFLSFKKNWDDMVLELTRFSKPMLAAINGYSPAGGCVLAITCDARLMAEGEQFMIGLNEVAVGIAVPENIYQLYAFWIGSRLAYQNLLTGKLMTAQEAQEIKLVDAVLPMETLLPAAEQLMQQILRTPGEMLRKSKLAMRRELIHKMESSPKPPEEELLRMWYDPEARALMKAVVDRLNK